MPSKIIFGASQPWPTFEPVNDTIRGGKSSSFWRVDEESNVAKFSGNLDITALGGAGFASRSTTFTPHRLAFPPTSPGLLLTFLPPSPSFLPRENDTLSMLTPRKPTVFHLNLKNEQPGRREDGRRESVVNYEFEIDTEKYAGVEAEGWEGAGTVEGDEEKLIGGWDKGDRAEGRRDAVTVLAKWEDFKPTYRGKPQEGAKKLDPSSIYELSFMCRSSFGQQAGEFELEIVSLAEAGKETKRVEGWVERFVRALREWRKRAWVWLGWGEGRVKL